MTYRKEQLTKTRANAKRYVRYKEGAELYSIGLTKFQQLSIENRKALVYKGLQVVRVVIYDRFTTI